MKPRKTDISNKSNARSGQGLRARSGRFADHSTKLEFIEGMRGIAALFVVISHFCSMVDAKFLDTGKSIADPWLKVLMSPFWNSHLAVAAFIVLSGFSLQFGLYQRGNGRVYGLGNFFKRRALRILPAYYACLALSYWVCQQVTIPQGDIYPFKNYTPITDDSLWAHIFLVHNWSPDWMYKINGVLWSIGLEAQLYLLFPWLILVMQKRSPLALLAVVAIPTALIVSYVPGAGKTYSWFAILFAFGMLAAHFSYRPNLKIGPNAATGIVLSVIAALSTAGILAYNISRGVMIDATTLIWSDISFGLATATFLYAATVAPGSWLERIFSMKVLVRLGIFSYSLYLVHHPILQIIYVNKPANILGPEWTMAYLFGFGLPVIVAISWVFSLLFERPFVKSRLPISEFAESEVAKIPLPLQVAHTIVMDTKEGYAYLEGAEQKEPPAKARGSSRKRKKRNLY